MPRRDIYHASVKKALELDGWEITHDPLSYRIDNDQIFIDLGAERVIGAQKGTLKIAVEVKSFLSPSPLTDLQEAIGQFVLYKEFLEELEPNRIMVLAIPESAAPLFEQRIGQRLLKSQNFVVIVYDVTKEVISRWLGQIPKI